MLLIIWGIEQKQSQMIINQLCHKGIVAKYDLIFPKD